MFKKAVKTVLPLFLTILLFKGCDSTKPESPNPQDEKSEEGKKENNLATFSVGGTLSSQVIDEVELPANAQTRDEQLPEDESDSGNEDPSTAEENGDSQDLDVAEADPNPQQETDEHFGPVP